MTGSKTGNMTGSNTGQRMRIVGIQKNSFVDYPGKIATVLFTPGCNFDCYYCHNRHIIEPGYTPDKEYSAEEILDFLSKRKGLLDAVVISGGEPTLQPGLKDFMLSLREAGFLVKLDTNGTKPGVIEDIIRSDAANYIAMDIKSPFYMYDAICGVRVNKEAIAASIKVIMESGIDYEFRTTVIPQISAENIIEMAEMIRGAKSYVLQQYRKPVWAVEAEVADIRLHKPPHTKEVLEAMASSVIGIVEKCTVRGA